MSLISWNDRMSVKVKEIDDQHKQLIAMINELNEGMQKGRGQDALGKLIAGLAAYAVMHFTTEERHFAALNYPEAPAHKAEHEKFVAEVSAFKRNFDAGTVGLSIPVMTFLSKWLRQHIMGSDMKYAPFFAAKGIH